MRSEWANKRANKGVSEGGTEWKVLPRPGTPSLMRGSRVSPLVRVISAKPRFGLEGIRPFQENNLSRF